MHSVLALDPGVTTGYCLAVLEDPTKVYVYYGERKLSHLQLLNALHRIEPDYVVCEDFYYRQRQGASVDFTPAELIGIVKLWAEPSTTATDRRDQVYFQGADKQGKKAHFTDERLKQLDIYKKGTNHGRSAVKHFLHWLNFGAGYQLIVDVDPALQLVEEDWLLGAYWNHINPWS